MESTNEDGQEKSWSIMGDAYEKAAWACASLTFGKPVESTHILPMMGYFDPLAGGDQDGPVEFERECYLPIEGLSEEAFLVSAGPIARIMGGLPKDMDGPEEVSKVVTNYLESVKEIVVRWWPEIKLVAEELGENGSIAGREILELCPRLRTEYLEVNKRRRDGELLLDILWPKNEVTQEEINTFVAGESA